MNTYTSILSETRLDRLRAQGFISQTDQELSELAFGIRFGYRLCLTVVVVALIFQSTFLFAAMACTAFLSVMLPNHPFDYIYNHLLSGKMNRPKLPPRSKQLKFACTIATIWLSTVTLLLFFGLTTAANIAAGMLVVVAGLLSTIDFCIPSLIYNALFPSTSKTV